MKLCPRNADSFNAGKLTDEQAREWCKSQFNQVSCQGCTCKHKPAGKKEAPKATEKETPEQRKLWG